MAGSALSDELFLNWEGYEEQLGEAEFLWGQRERQLFSPEYRLPQVAEREERLLASEDVLVLGGVAVARGVLVPALASETPARIATAAHALLTGGAPGAAEAVREAVEGEAEGVVPAVMRALELVEANNLPAWLPRLLEAPSAPLKTLALGALGTHGSGRGVGPCHRPTCRLGRM